MSVPLPSPVEPPPPPPPRPAAAPEPAAPDRAAMTASAACRHLDWPRMDQNDPDPPDVQETSRWLRCAAVYRRVRGVVVSPARVRSGLPDFTD